MKENEQQRVLCVLPVLGQPRHAKRISMLQQAGFEVEAVAFERDYHSGRLPNCSVERLGKINQGRYFQRALSLISILPALRRAIRQNQMVYTFGSDMALTAIVAGAGLDRPVILEVGDIRRVQVSLGLKGRIVRMLDRYIVRFIKLLVVTAPGFVSGYYQDWLKAHPPSLVLENKLEATGTELDRADLSTTISDRPLVDRPLRIGYFGLLRCGWSWKILEALAISRTDEIEIIVAGHPMVPVDLAERTESLANIQFRGEFKSPVDLPTLYGDVDIIWGCYPCPEPGDYNWRWARTNRFYESCFFQKPIIALSGSSDAVEVERYGIGMTVAGSDIESAVDAISGISPEDLALWQDNLLHLPRHVYEYTTEVTDLAQAIRGIITDQFS